MFRGSKGKGVRTYTRNGKVEKEQLYIDFYIQTGLRGFLQLLTKLQLRRETKQSKT